ncbi:MAG TPA: thermonuclease family protein [Blastocatellia bacterium]|nr:thermonuclease family protein [Blastocatellia bacterium]
MLQFKEHQIETDELPSRWSIGIDRRHVATYVGLALIAGFAAGFIVSRYVPRKETTEPPPLSENRTPTRQPAEAPPGEFHRVSRILRADVIEVEGVGPVRLLGIETPDGKSPKEIYGEHGQRAINFAEKSLLGQDVRLEFDTESGIDKDETGQTLAYVYTRDGALVNGEMVKQGFAFVRGSEQFRLANEFRGFERDAMQAMRGVWGSSSSSASLASTPPSTTAPPPLEDEKQKKLSPLAPSAFGANIPALSGSPTTPLEPSVWVSPGDKMYHKSGCEFLEKKKRTVPLSQAKGEGFTACSRCYASTVLKAP